MIGDGYPAFLAKMVRQFVKEAGECVNEVQQAVQRGDMDGLAKAAHGLKGISGNMGVKPMAALAFELEQQGRQNVSKGNSKRCLELEGLFHRVQEEFEKELQK